MKIENVKDFREKVLYPCVRVSTGKAGGSGQVIHASDNGTFVLTCHHVVEGAINVKKEWSQLLQREVQKDVMSPVNVEFFVYKYEDRAIGSTKVQAEIVCYDKNEDIALLRLDADPRTDKWVASMMPCEGLDDPEVSKKVDYTAPVITIGAALGSDPLMTTGNLSGFGILIDNREYWLATSAAVYGNCLAQDTLVSMSNGTIKKIKDVQAGDYVLGYGELNSGMSREVKVEEVIKSGRKKILKIKTRNRTIRLSKDHPVVKISKVYDWSGKIRNIPQWVEAGDLTEGECIFVMSSHIPYERQTQGFNFAKEIGQDEDPTRLMEFLGFFVGDGYKRYRKSEGGEVQLYTFNETLGKKYKSIMEDLFSVNVSVVGNYETLRVSSVALVKKLTEWGFNGLSKTKTIPDWVFSTVPENQMAFLRGYCEADGYINPSGAWVFEAANETLINQFRMLCMHLGMQVCNVSSRSRTTTLNGRELKTDCWSFQAYPSYSRSPNSCIDGEKSLIPDDLNYVKITSVEEDGEDETYDIKLDKRHAFFADGVLVHNSGGATFLADTWEFVGMPARIAVTGIFGQDAITHMCYIVPITRISQFLKDNLMLFFFNKDLTYNECKDMIKRKRETSELDMLAAAMKGDTTKKDSVDYPEGHL
jgi:intein/homing endonuclease